MGLREEQDPENLWETVVYCGGLWLVNEKPAALRRYGPGRLFPRR